MTNKELEIRNKANFEGYVNNNRTACIDAVMELYNRIPDVGGVFKSLFRYRSLNSDELNSLENETIFMRWPSSYKDDGDCTPVFDFEEISKYIIKEKYPLLNAEKTVKERININDIKENPKFMEKIKDLRDMWMIACFTERHDNERMWREYANNETGICLVYSFYEVLNMVKATDGMSIMPVRYVNNREKCGDIALNHKDLLDIDDNSDAKYRLTCTTKGMSYKFEEEWRLIYEREKEDADGDAKGDCIPFVNPKLIICGKSIDKESVEYQKLLDIVEKKGIKMV